MCISQCNRDCVIYMYECVFIRLCVLLDVFILLAKLGWMVRLTDSDAHLCVSRFPGVSFAPCFVLCVCVFVLACLHTPHLDRYSQMSSACGRWYPLENRIHTVPNPHSLLAPFVAYNNSFSPVSLGSSCVDHGFH